MSRRCRRYEPGWFEKVEIMEAHDVDAAAIEVEGQVHRRVLELTRSTQEGLSRADFVPGLGLCLVLVLLYEKLVRVRCRQWPTSITFTQTCCLTSLSYHVRHQISHPACCEA